MDSLKCQTSPVPRQSRGISHSWLSFAAAPSRARRVVRGGDTIVSTVRTYLKAVYFVDGDCEELVCSTGFAVLTPSTRAVPKFVSYLCQSKSFTDRVTADSVGIAYPAIAETRLGAFHVAVPPVPEQAAIVRFLDHADRRIRRYIGAKQKLIKLLEEQKQAIIHRAVTRGLDPNVRLKPSGVEWLGDVPEHWSLKRFKFLAHVTSGQVDPRLPEHRSKILIAPNHIRSGAGWITHQETAAEQGADSGKYEVQKGQIIYSKIRPNLRKAAIATTNCLCSADMYPLTVRESELQTAYMLQLLLSVPFTKYAVDCSLRVAMPKVNREALGECWLWYPPLDEQAAVLKFIRQATAPSDRAIERAQREIGLLREYRTRLIADVVTGKIDVREAAARLPQEAEDLELFDETEVESEAQEADAGDPDEAPEEVEA